MSHGARLPLLAGALLGLAPLPAGATVIIPLSIEDMATQSACVVRGRVVDQRADWDEGHQRIYTTTEIEVLEVVHSTEKAPARITVRTLGGEVGKIGMKVAGTEQFTLAEEVFLFLRHDPVVGSAYQVVGMSQGKYKLQAEAKGRMVAVPSVEGLAFARPDPTSGTLKVDARAPAVDRIPLVELKQRVLAAVQSAASVPQPALPVTTPQASPLETR